MATPDQLPAFVASIPLLRGLPAEDIARLVRRAPPPRLYVPAQKGEGSASVYEERAASTALYVVLDATLAPSGMPAGGAQPVVQVSVEDDKLTTRVRLWRVYPRNYFGDFEFLAGSENGRFPIRLSKAVALTPSPVLEIPYKLLDAFIDDHPIVFRRLAREAIARFQQTLEDTLAGKVSDPDVALANWIVERARDFGIKEGNHVRFRRAFPQEDIGRDLGVSRETISLRLNEWRRRGLVAPGRAFVVRDMERVERIAALALERSRDEHASAVEAVDAALARGDNFRARNFALDVLGYFPGSAELRHRAALAIARCGATRDALSLLERFGFGEDASPEALAHAVRSGVIDPSVVPKPLQDAFDADEQDEQIRELGEAAKVATLVEDILALAPRLWKDLAFQGQAVDKTAARKALDGYSRAFAASARPYSGVNAASLALVLGRPAEGRGFAKDVLAKLPKKPTLYWDLAAAGEAHLLLGDMDRARQCLETALACADAFEGSVAATRLQLQRLATAKIAGAADLLAALPNHAIVGHASDEKPGQPAAAAMPKLAAVEESLRALQAGHLHGALGSAADVVAAEAALAAGIAVHLVLPIPADELFAALGFPPAGKAEASWRSRFDQCLAGAASLTVLPLRAPAARELPAAIHQARRFAIGQALVKADTLLAPCRQLLLDGGKPRLVPLDRTAGPADAAASKADALWRPAVFVWLLSATGEAPLTARGVGAEVIETAEALVRAQLGPGTALVRRSLAGNRPQTALVAIPPDFASALTLADGLLRARWPNSITVQIGLDFGPLLGAGEKPNEERLKDLDLGGGPLEVPENTPVASASFAMPARVALGEAISVVALGRVARLETTASGMQPLPSAEIYTVMNRA